VLLSSLAVLMFDDIVNESTTNSVDDWRIGVGWAIISVISLCLAVNVLYLIPVKISESYQILKLVFKWLGSFVCKCRQSKVGAETKQDRVKVLPPGFDAAKKSSSFS